MPNAQFFHPIFIFLICFFNPLVCMDWSSMQKEPQFIQYFFDQEGRPTKGMRALIEYTGVTYDEDAKDQSLAINAATQEAWYTGCERHEIDSEMCDDGMVSVLRDLGMWREKRPKEKSYTGVVALDIHYIKDLGQRLAWLRALKEQGHMFGAYYMCASNWPMHSFAKQDFIEGISALTKADSTNEAVEPYNNYLYRSFRNASLEQMMRGLFNYISSPKEGKKPIWVVSQPYADGTRPTTHCNVRDFLKVNPDDGHYCIVSSHPDGQYQHLVFATHTLRSKKDISYDITMAKTLAILNEKALLDRIARGIYANCEYLKVYRARMKEIHGE